MCVEELVTETLSHFSERFEAAGIRLEWENRTSTTLSIDPFWLRQALVNLLENALSSCRAEAGCHVDSRRLSGVLATLGSDDGPGIRPEAARTSAPALRIHRPGGTGLGLALVQKIVTAHDGRVEVLESAWGGARFDLLFPEAARRARGTLRPGIRRSPRPA